MPGATGGASRQDNMMGPTLVRQDFDSLALGLDFYRVVRFDHGGLARELASLAPPFMADAKLPAEDIAGSKELQRLGFRKACVQPVYALDLAGRRGTAPGEPLARYEMDPGELDAHAANFPFSRFGLDPFVPEAARIEHQRRWIANSMASPDVPVFVEKGAFVSFKLREDAAVIDLISVLPSERGRGSLLLGRLAAWSAARGLARTLVTTESENVPACRFYQKNGYHLIRAFTAFHLHREAPR
jgi:GNAT superfamily N-acetyltransferase